MAEGQSGARRNKYACLAKGQELRLGADAGDGSQRLRKGKNRSAPDAVSRGFQALPQGVCGLQAGGFKVFLSLFH